MTKSRSTRVERESSERRMRRLLSSRAIAWCDRQLRGLRGSLQAASDLRNNYSQLKSRLVGKGRRLGRLDLSTNFSSGAKMRCDRVRIRVRDPLERRRPKIRAYPARNDVHATSVTPLLAGYKPEKEARRAREFTSRPDNSDGRCFHN